MVRNGSCLGPGSIFDERLSDAWTVSRSCTCQIPAVLACCYNDILHHPSVAPPQKSPGALGSPFEPCCQIVFRLRLAFIFLSGAISRSDPQSCIVTPVPGTFTRISESPLVEWHGFATVPEPGMKGYSLVVSRAGDWTSKHIENPPTHMWVRGIPTCGVLRIVPLFRRLVFVATGSGIGPCAPCILEKRVPIRLLWTSPNVRKTFGDKLVDSLLAASPDAVIYGEYNT